MSLPSPPSTVSFPNPALMVSLPLLVLMLLLKRWLKLILSLPLPVVKLVKFSTLLTRVPLDRLIDVVPRSLIVKLVIATLKSASTRISVPVPPLMTFIPAPPLRVSSPAPPLIVSSPDPVVILSLANVPVI
ncbi:hypothetical protein C7H19_24945 [Aphanothece hegewaldii CCALA 016]|uniref:Uncharacterized protein n=1 Tax=Aphanothece hegewaldii CCALA 016 TaxID=2107694 RepID=A0A2T1LQD6_9CHRO|nr:hypothetical protein C7H19_24945 [Aphanothece hegewaldii CCALA 016]